MFDCPLKRVADVDVDPTRVIAVISQSLRDDDGKVTGQQTIVYLEHQVAVTINNISPDEVRAALWPEVNQV